MVTVCNGPPGSNIYRPVSETHQTADAAGKKKHGPKPSPPCDELHESKTNNTRVPYSLLCLLAGMVVAQYNAGFPLSTTLLMPMVLGFIEVHSYHGCPRSHGTGSSC